MGLRIVGSGGGDYEAWNYHDPEAADYWPSITGTVVELAEIQSRNFNTKKPEFWENGTPKLSLRITVQGKTGKRLPWVISPKSVGYEALLRAFKAEAGFDLIHVGGTIIKITTTNDRNQWTKSSGGGMARPWTVELVDNNGFAPFEGYKEFGALPAEAPRFEEATEDIEF